MKLNSIYVSHFYATKHLYQPDFLHCRTNHHSKTEKAQGSCLWSLVMNNVLTATTSHKQCRYKGLFINTTVTLLDKVGQYLLEIKD